MTKKQETQKGDGSSSPLLIKKYPNRRLYNTSTSSYIVLDDIVKLVKGGEEFVIQDAKTGDDITRSILNQIIFERETKPSNYHFPLEVQKQLIGMYDDTYGRLIPDYLKESMKLFSNEREKMSEAVEDNIGRNTRAMMEFSQSMARQNAEMFRRSWEMFTSAMPGNPDAGQEADAEVKKNMSREEELDEIQEKIESLQARLKSLKD